MPEPDAGLHGAAAAAGGVAATEPFYLPAGNEVALFEQCHARQLAVMLKGPTGCGKTRFIEHMAWRLGRPLVTIACHDDLSASDLRALLDRLVIERLKAEETRLIASAGQDPGALQRYREVHKRRLGLEAARPVGS